jgi:hypothetical protein
MSLLPALEVKAFAMSLGLFQWERTGHSYGKCDVGGDPGWFDTTDLGCHLCELSLDV